MVSVGCNVWVGALVLEASGVVVVVTLVLVGNGRANFIPPSERARRKTPVTIAQENNATMMPIAIPTISRPRFSLLSFIGYALLEINWFGSSCAGNWQQDTEDRPFALFSFHPGATFVSFNQRFYNR